MRLGIYSGTFDPIHEGHVLFAQVAIEQFGLDEVIFLVEEKPRYKQNVTGLNHRQAMLRVAIQDQPSMNLFEYSLEPSHTIEGVLTRIARDYPDDEYYVMMGGDVFSGIASWGARADEKGSVAQVKDSIGFVVGVSNQDELDTLQSIQDELGLNVRFIEVPLASTSSSHIRRTIKEGNKAQGLNDNVQQYIQENTLYQA